MKRFKTINATGILLRCLGISPGHAGQRAAQCLIRRAVQTRRWPKNTVFDGLINQ